MDDDGDGVGDTESVVEACDPPDGTVPRGGDCDDSDPDVFPGQAERCNGRDDNCDDAVDGPDSVDLVTYYQDADGDGFGTDPAELCPDAAGPDWIDTHAGLDCDDSDPQIHPGATERCNAVDDDCDPATDETGAVRFVDFTGETYDWGAGVLTGQVGFIRPGTVELCHGTHPMTLRPRAELSIRAAAAATDRPRITGAPHGGPALLLRDDGLAVTLDGVDLHGGRGTAVVLGEGSGGGAIECDTDGTLDLFDTTVTGGEADVGGSVLVRGGCILTATEVVVEGGTATWAGGLVAVLAGAATFVDSDLSTGTAPVGGGVAVVASEGPAELVLDHTALRGSSAARLGGGAYVEGASLTCQGDPAGGIGLSSNMALEGGGVWLAAESRFDAVDCDMGSGTTDNLVHDVAWDDRGTLGASWSGPATFTCTSEGCE